MMQQINTTVNPILTNSTIKSMLNTLSNVLKSDATLANDLLIFLNEREVDIPILSDAKLRQLIPVSYNQKNSAHNISQLRNSFEAIGTIEFIL